MTKRSCYFLTVPYPETPAEQGTTGTFSSGKSAFLTSLDTPGRNRPQARPARRRTSTQQAAYRYAPTQQALDATRPNMMIRVVTKTGINHGVLALKRLGVHREDRICTRHSALLQGAVHSASPPWFSSAPHSRPRRPLTPRAAIAGPPHLRLNAPSSHNSLPLLPPNFSF
jgi:hypothetical protein